MLVRIVETWDGTDVALDPDGFVHLSRAEQVEGTVARHYAGCSSLVFLVLDEGALPTGALRDEEAPGGEVYPHLYARLPAGAVTRAVRWTAGQPIDL